MPVGFVAIVVTETRIGAMPVMGGQSMDQRTLLEHGGVEARPFQVTSRGAACRPSARTRPEFPLAAFGDAGRTSLRTL